MRSKRWITRYWADIWLNLSLHCQGVCQVQDHEWGHWGAPKFNDKGEYLEYRRCQKCDYMESRPGVHSPNWVTGNLPSGLYVSVSGKI
jgi:hypothetical protein